MTDFDLDVLVEEAAMTLKLLLARNRTYLAAAITHTCAEAEAQKKKPKLGIRFAIGLDFNGDEAEYSLSFGVRHKDAVKLGLPNRDQTEMQLIEKTQQVA